MIRNKRGGGEKPKSLNGASQEGAEFVAMASRGFQFMGRKASSALSSLLIPTAVIFFLSKSFYIAPQGLTLGWADICCYFLLHSVLFGDILLISSFFDLASLFPLPALLPLSHLQQLLLVH